MFIGISTGIACQAGGMAGGGGAEPALIADADFANDSYTLNGESVTFADLFVDSTFAAPTADVGLQVEKLAGTSSTAFAQAKFSPELFALVNQPGGFTAVANIYSDNLTVGPVAKINTVFKIDYTGPGFAHCSKNAIYNWGEEDGGSIFSIYNYDYDVVGVGDFGSAIVASVGAGGGTYIGSIAEAVRAYFGEFPLEEAVVDVANPFPHDGVDYALMSVSVNPHHGTSLEKEPTTGRMNVARLRIYTPAQAAGWTPGN